MRPPFPGMDPWLEHPDLWPDVHNSLIAAIRDAMTPEIAPYYYIGIQQRTYQVVADEVTFWGVPDLTVATASAPRTEHALAPARRAAGVREVELPMRDEIRETFLEVRKVGSGRLVTLLEVLSPANKFPGRGRKQYLRKRERVLVSRTNLLEIDLLRDGTPMDGCGGEPVNDYRILVSRDQARPMATLHEFSVRDAIPIIDLPLLPGDREPPMDLGAVLHGVYDRARFDLRLRYDQPPTPPLLEEDAEWARGVVG